MQSVDFSIVFNEMWTKGLYKETMMMLDIKERLNKKPAATLMTKFRAGLIIILFFML